MSERSKLDKQIRDFSRSVVDRLIGTGATDEDTDLVVAYIRQAIKLALTMEPSATMLDAALAGGAYSKSRAFYVYRAMNEATLKEWGME